MFRYRLHSPGGDDLGETTYAVMISPGEEILTGIDSIVFIQLGAKDVVRHRIVQDIVEAYRTHGERSVRRQATRIPDRSGRKGIDGRQR